MTILHIIPDDQFWESPIKIFEKTSYTCKYISIVNDAFHSFEFINSSLIKPIYEKDVNELWNNIDIDIFLFHSFPTDFYKYVLSIPKGKIVIVSSWGYDIYYPHGQYKAVLPIQLYKTHTKLFLKQIQRVPLLISLKRKVKQIVFNYHSQTTPISNKHLVTSLHQEQIQAINRVDYWATILPIEYEMLTKIEGFRAKYFPFQYTTRCSNTNYPQIDTQKAQKILVGNSADPSNNHIDILKIIKRRGIKNQLFIPLAHAGDSVYERRLVNYLSNKEYNYSTQLTIVPRDEYFNNLLSCRVGVFGHLRQQALGNIISCFLQGSKVFLYKDSITYKYFKESKFVVFSIEEDLTQKSIDEPLSEEQKKINKRILDLFSIDAVIPKINCILDEIEHTNI